MDQVSDDVLILTFRAYLEEPSTMPIVLTPICRRWCNLVKSTPILWSKIVIKVNSNTHLALIASSSGFQEYLSRTDIDISLDIELTIGQPSEEEHINFCGSVASIASHGAEPRLPCYFPPRRKESLYMFLTLLAGPESSTHPMSCSPFESKKPSVASRIASQASRLRLHRWRSLLFDWNYSNLNFYGNCHEFWVQSSFNYAPRLTYLTLCDVPSPYEPPASFAPNLQHLALYYLKSDESVALGLVNSPKLKSLSLKIMYPNLWERLSGICNAEEVDALEKTFIKRPGSVPIDIKFPNLKRLKVSVYCFRRVWSVISREFQNTDRRLEEVYLVDFSHRRLDEASEISAFTNSRRVVFAFSPRNIRTVANGEPKEPPQVIGPMKKFLLACSVDTEVIVLDEYHEKILAEARTEIRQEQSDVTK